MHSQGKALVYCLNIINTILDNQENIRKSIHHKM